MAETTQDAQQTQDQQSSPIDPVQAVEQRRRAAEIEAFKAYLERRDMKIPDNFKSVDDYFDSLKGATAKMTQATQELAETRKAKEAADKKLAEAAEAAKPEALEIPKKPEATKPKEDAAPTGPVPFTQKDWDEWTVEVGRTGDLSKETREKIISKHGLQEFAIVSMINGVKAQVAQNTSIAHSIVGGKENLKLLFAWAQDNLPQKDLDGINEALKGPAMATTIRGLMYQHITWMAENKPKQQEAAAVAPKAEATVQAGTKPVATSGGAVNTDLKGKPFTTRKEMYAARNKPAYNTDPKYRAFVDGRIAATPKITSLPAA